MLLWLCARLTCASAKAGLVVHNATHEVTWCIGFGLGGLLVGRELLEANNHG